MRTERHRHDCSAEDPALLFPLPVWPGLHVDQTASSLVSHARTGACRRVDLGSAHAVQNDAIEFGILLDQVGSTWKASVVQRHRIP